MRLAILAHQGVGLKGPLHRCVRVVGAEQLRIVLHIFGVLGLGQHGPAGRLDAKDGRFSAKPLIDRIGVRIQLLQCDVFIQRGKISHAKSPFRC